MVSAGIVTTENSFFVKFNYAKISISGFAIRNFFKVKSVLCYSKNSLTVHKIFWSENQIVGTYLNFCHFIYLTMYIGVIIYNELQITIIFKISFNSEAMYMKEFRKRFKTVKGSIQGCVFSNFLWWSRPVWWWYGMIIE